MAADFIKSSVEQLIRKMMSAKDQNIEALYRHLSSNFGINELRENEIERVINNYEAICSEYMKKSQKKILRSVNYLNRRLYRNLKSEINRLNERLIGITKKMERLERLIDEQGN